MKLVSCNDCNLSFDVHKGKACPHCGVVYSETAAPKTYALGYPQCEWESNGERCRYPGAISSNIGGGPWYCRHHFECSSPAFGEQVVIASRDYRHATKDELTKEATAEAYKASGGQRVRHVPRTIGAKDKTAWARRIIEKGEDNVSRIAWQMACEALGVEKLKDVA